MTSAAPGTSSLVRVPPGAYAGTTRAITALITTPTGTLMKKFHRQPAYDVSTPPSSRPTAAPPVATADQ